MLRSFRGSSSDFVGSRLPFPTFGCSPPCPPSSSLSGLRCACACQSLRRGHQSRCLTIVEVSSSTSLWNSLCLCLWAGTGPVTRGAERLAQRLHEAEQRAEAAGQARCLACSLLPLLIILRPVRRAHLNLLSLSTLSTSHHCIIYILSCSSLLLCSANRSTTPNTTSSLAITVWIRWTTCASRHGPSSGRE